MPVHRIRRFYGKVLWDGVCIGCSNNLHSISFRFSRRVQFEGFDMFCGPFPYRIAYCISEGMGVMGRVVARGVSAVRKGTALLTTCSVMLSRPIVANSMQWYTVSVLVQISSYEQVVSCAVGTGGVSSVITDKGLHVDFACGLESSVDTTIESGLIPCVLYSSVEEINCTEDKRDATSYYDVPTGTAPSIRSSAIALLCSPSFGDVTRPTTPSSDN